MAGALIAFTIIMKLLSRISPQYKSVCTMLANSYYKQLQPLENDNMSEQGFNGGWSCFASNWLANYFISQEKREGGEAEKTQSTCIRL